jgi:hypothetical protein
MEEEKLTAGKKEAGGAVSTSTKEGEPYTIEGNEGAKGAGFPAAAGGNSPAGDSPVVVSNPQGETRGDASFVEAARKYKV